MKTTIFTANEYAVLCSKQHQCLSPSMTFISYNGLVAGTIQQVKFEQQHQH